MPHEQNISFLHSGLPNCISPIVSHIAEIPEFQGIHGTGFFARKADNIFFITARHCLTKDPQADIADIAGRLHIPYELTGYKSSQKDYVQFASIYSFTHESDEIPDKFVDQVILEVDVQKKSKQHKHLLSRAAKLPPSGDWFDNFTRQGLVEQAFLNGGKIPIIVIGYPVEGTATKITDDGEIISQAVKMSGNLVPGLFPHTMSMIDITWKHDLNGFSGSPAFIQYRSHNGPQQALVGMIILGGNYRAQFIRISQLSLSRFEPPLGTLVNT